MQRARAFFFACAGIFLLALSFHLGATSARGQVGGTGWFIAGNNGGPFVLTASGDSWRYIPGYGWLNDLGNIFGGASAGRTIVSVLPGEVATSTGEVWYGTVVAGTWTNAGVPPVGPTPARQESFGQLKAQYRK